MGGCDRPGEETLPRTRGSVKDDPPRTQGLMADGPSATDHEQKREKKKKKNRGKEEDTVESREQHP